jgi:hypothetical protein
MPDFENEFGICPYILPQVVICGIHKVAEFTPRDVVGVSWDELRLNAFLEEFPSVAMVLPFLLSHSPPPCGGITFQIGLSKFHGRMSSNLGGMNIVFHFRKLSIHNLLVADTIEVPGFGLLKSHILR